MLNKYQASLALVIKDSVNLQLLQGKTVLITGATGTIGSVLVDTLRSYNQSHGAGIQVFATISDVNRLDKAALAGVTWLNYDMHKPIAFDESVDYIIHAAGNAHPAAFNVDPVGTIIGNVLGTHNLLEYGKTHGMQRMLYISTGEIYGQADSQIEKLEETYSGYVDSLCVRSCYSSSKRAAETLCACYSAQHGVETVIARPCHIYGPKLTPSDNRAHADFLRNAVAGEDIVLKSTGGKIRSYCYSADCASALLTILINGECGSAYNIANPNAIASIADLAQAFASKAGLQVIYDIPSQSQNDTPIQRQVLDSSRLESLGWKARYDIRSGVSQAIEILYESILYDNKNG